MLSIVTILNNVTNDQISRLLMRLLQLVSVVGNTIGYWSSTLRGCSTILTMTCC